MTIEDMDKLGPLDYARLLKTGEASSEELQEFWEELIARRPIDLQGFAAKVFPVNELPLEFLRLIDEQVLSSDDDALKTLWLRALLGRNSGARCLELVVTSKAQWRMVPMFSSTAFQVSTEELQRITTLYPASLEYIVETPHFVPTEEQLSTAAEDGELAILLMKTQDSTSRLKLLQLLDSAGKLENFTERASPHSAITAPEIDFILSKVQTERAIFFCLTTGREVTDHELLAPYQAKRLSSYSHGGISLYETEAFVYGEETFSDLRGLQGLVFQNYGVAVTDFTYDPERKGYVGKILA